MPKPSRVAEVEALIREIQRYLQYIDALRDRPSAPPAEEPREEEDA